MYRNGLTIIIPKVLETGQLKDVVLPQLRKSVTGEALFKIDESKTLFRACCFLML
jgi:hypothetical protein